MSITRVDASADLRNAKVYVSVLGDETQKTQSVAGLNSASGYIHRAIKKILNMKNVPFFKFYLDDSLELGAEVLELIKQVSSGDEQV